MAGYTGKITLDKTQKITAPIQSGKGTKAPKTSKGR